MELTAGEQVPFWHHATYALQEIAQVAPGLETEQIELEQGAQQTLLLRKLGENVVWRKGDVQEKCQRFMHATLTQRLRDIH